MTRHPRPHLVIRPEQGAKGQTSTRSFPVSLHLRPPGTYPALPNSTEGTIMTAVLRLLLALVAAPALLAVAVLAHTTGGVEAVAACAAATVVGAALALAIAPRR